MPDYNNSFGTSGAETPRVSTELLQSMVLYEADVTLEWYVAAIESYILVLSGISLVAAAAVTVAVTLADGVESTSLSS